MTKPQKSEVTVWRLRRGMDRRFRSGHPWIYSNELMESPQGIQPGQLIELCDAGGKFLARGFGNPHSLIAFRCLSRNPEELDPASPARIVEKLLKAQAQRILSGWTEGSYRLCFGEADDLPGLIVDRYQTAKGQIFVVQAHTAGANHLSKNILEILKAVVEAKVEAVVRTGQGSITWENTGVILRNDVSVRKLEGLAEESNQVLRELKGENFSDLQILIRPVLEKATPENLLGFQVDLLGGQKTGFFLDQFANIQIAALRFQNFPQKKIRILDLFSYVGHWGAQLARVFKAQGKEVEVVAVDASAKALEFAKKNITAAGARCETVKMDILKDLEKLSKEKIAQMGFDIVISDPPALIKARKDIPTGKHAYLQLATQALPLVRKGGGGIVSCSCSSLLPEEDFNSALSRGAQRNQIDIQWVARGSQSPDHPVKLSFPEGKYLKAWVGIRTENP